MYCTAFSASIVMGESKGEERKRKGDKGEFGTWYRPVLG